MRVKLVHQRTGKIILERQFEEVGIGNEFKDEKYSIAVNYAELFNDKERSLHMNSCLYYNYGIICIPQYYLLLFAVEDYTSNISLESVNVLEYCPVNRITKSFIQRLTFCLRSVLSASMMRTELFELTPSICKGIMRAVMDGEIA